MNGIGLSVMGPVGGFVQNWILVSGWCWIAESGKRRLKQHQGKGMGNRLLDEADFESEWIDPLL